MANYMIQDSHKIADCLKVLDAFAQAGAHYLTNADWGCEYGDHTGWIVVEAGSDDEARLMVPPIIRKRARLVRLSRFTLEQIRGFHQEAELEEARGGDDRATGTVGAPGGTA